MRENNGRLYQIFLLHYVQTTFHSSYIKGGGGHIVTYTTYWFIKEYTEGKNRDKEKWNKKREENSKISYIMHICIYFLKLMSINIINSIFNYRPFQKTLPRSSAFVYWISVRFYETDCSKKNIYIVTSFPVSEETRLRELLSSIHDTANKIWASLSQNDQGQNHHKLCIYLSIYLSIYISIYLCN